MRTRKESVEIYDSSKAKPQTAKFVQEHVPEEQNGVDDAAGGVDDKMVEETEEQNSNGMEYDN